MHRAGREFGPYFPDVFHDRVTVATALQTPHDVVYPVPVEDLARVGGEEFYDAKLDLR